jgi:hypothetical protein
MLNLLYQIQYTTIDQLMKTDVKHYEWDTDKEYYFVDINYKKSMFNMIRPAAQLPCPTLNTKRTTNECIWCISL